ncbi:biotin/lipoyl-containing protein [Dysgonomonas sp. BGC7]|uniref:biotin/lipoyl-containing protein n=1 Tax=Dysgonomonas sp. BGC7 TaxID=1658008 RepID=UPI00068130FF|nr:biotin/lipoyl-containing protein [Dysgonomonas sp. BGC7]MBD8389923.1 biotin/lipoyl-binding protein [Dysgonomonas sp. BGC7]
MKQFIYRINGQEYVVAVNKMDNSVAEVAVNGTNYSVELVNNEEEVTFVSRPAAKAPVASAPVAPKVTASAPASSGTVSGAGALKSPLPGIVVAINVNVGDVVKKGQQVATLEAMKMENALAAPIDGTVQSINVNVGDSVLEGVVILAIA